MAQTYNAQGDIIQGKQQSVRVYNNNLQTNSDTLRSTFSGTAFPETAVVGQHCYRTDLDMEFVYTTQNTWVEANANSSTALEVDDARGSLPDLDTRLSVALNEDGTLKNPSLAEIDEWKDNAFSPSFVTSRSFSVDGDYTSVFTANRKLYIELGENNVITYIVSSTYDNVAGKTVITVADDITDEISTVRYSIIQYGLPKSVVFNSDDYSLTISDDNVPTSDSASLSASLGGIANILKQVKGDDDWKTAPTSNIVTIAPLVDMFLRKPSTSYVVGDIKYSPLLKSWQRLECITAGTSSDTGMSVETPVEDGTEITDGSVVWVVKKISDIPVASETSNGLMSSNDKIKLDSIQIDSKGAIMTKTGRFGIRIDKRNSDPATRCEYIMDAQGMGPCGMDFTNGTFNYGDWADVWFVKNNKPCMLKSDGTVDYYLDANDYTKKEGTDVTSDVANTSYDGNAMSEIPLCYVKRWEDGRYEYEVVCETQYDDTYKAYAHTKADGTIANNFYWSMFGGSGNATRIRSLSGQSVAQSINTVNQVAGATANGDGWYIHSWSQRELIRTLCLLMGCSTDMQSVFGNGNCRGADSASGLLKTGTLNDKGQFFGYNNANQMKVFHIEQFWGNQWDRTAGLINDHGVYYIKMTPEGSGYRISDTTGYDNTGLVVPSGSGSYINKMNCSEHGMVPSLATGSSTTYYCDGYYTSNGQLNYLSAGGSANNASVIGGPFAFDVDTAPSNAAWNFGCGLSYV